MGALELYKVDPKTMPLVPIPPQVPAFVPKPAWLPLSQIVLLPRMQRPELARAPPKLLPPLPFGAIATVGPAEEPPQPPAPPTVRFPTMVTFTNQFVAAP